MWCGTKLQIIFINQIIMLKFSQFLSILAVIFLMFPSCRKKEVNPGTVELSVDRSEISAKENGGEEIISLKSNCYWDITLADADGKAVTWVNADPTKGQENAEIKVQISVNSKAKERTAYLYVSTPSSEDFTKTITITQEASSNPQAAGYDFPICQTIDIDSPQTRNLANAAISGNSCLFKNGMVLYRSDENKTLALECPAHTQPSAGTDVEKSIWRGIRFEDFAQGESILISVPVKDELYGDLRLMLGARAASFTADGWSYYWSADGESWEKINISKAQTPGSDAVWNDIYFTIPEAKKIVSEGTLYFKLTADGSRSKTYVTISNTICVCPAKAPMSNLPAMDSDKTAYTNGFDDLVDSPAAYMELPIGLMRTATTGYASNFTTFTNPYSVPKEQETIAKAYGCFTRPGYLQVGYYDESLWTRKAIGTYTIKIGERLKQMGVSASDAVLSFKAATMKDFRGYDNLAKITVSDGTTSKTFDKGEDRQWKEYSFEFKNLCQTSEITITCPKLSDEEIAALGRGEFGANLVDYRFFIDDLKVELTTIHSRGAEARGGNENYDNGNKYNW